MQGIYISESVQCSQVPKTDRVQPSSTEHAVQSSIQEHARQSAVVMLLRLNIKAVFM